MQEREKKTGSVLVFSLIILTMLLVSGIAIVSVAVLEKRSSFSTEKSVITFQSADSGAERVIKRIYINDSPTLVQVPLNGDIGSLTNPNNGDTTLDNLASNLIWTGSPTCDSTNKWISGTNNLPNPNYNFQVVFYDQLGNKISCNDNQWRDKVVKITSTAYYRNTDRAIEIGIRPRE